ncbi:MAG: ATP-binding protein [Bacteroidota bacterium]
MASRLREFLGHLKTYQFQLKHVTVLLFVILVFQIAVSFLHKASLEKFLTNTQEWYQQDSAERLANLTTTSLELLLEERATRQSMDEREARKMVQGLDIILSQQFLSQNVKEICVLVQADSGIVAIDEGKVLYAHMFEDPMGTVIPAAWRRPLQPAAPHVEAVAMYRRYAEQMRQQEQIRTVVEGKQTFHVFVPFVPRGEFVGAVYMRTSPDFSFITRSVISSYDETAVTFSALILFGLLAMYYISSYTLGARNEAQRQLFEKEKERLSDQINHQKEMLFTKRIYHTHHKAEKIMGFIKEDLRILGERNIEEVKARVMKYSNFIARVIYDMKWYDPPMHSYRGALFQTNLNDVLRFLVRDVFERVSGSRRQARFELALAPSLPGVDVNEFVAWEAFEPIIQNAVEHAGVRDVTVTVRSGFDSAAGEITVQICDNGGGLPADLLEADAQGVKRVFQESATTKNISDRHAGYGCYIAHEIATQRCGWRLDAANGPDGGACFTFTIPRGAEAAHG